MTSRRAIALGAAFVLVATALSLSDRAPGATKRIGRAGAEIWQRIEIAFAIDLDRDAIPWTPDEVAHLVLWGGGMVILGLALRARVRADHIAVGLFVTSIVLEVLQAFVTANRSLSLADGAANAVGIMLGLSVVVVFDLLLRARGQTPYPWTRTGDTR